MLNQAELDDLTKVMVFRTTQVLSHQTLSVYGEDPDTGRMTSLQASGIPCQLAIPSMTAQGGARAEEVSQRELRWDPSYTMPEVAFQVEIDGKRWNLVPGSRKEILAQDGVTRLYWAQFALQVTS